jgi:hypothetical protein
MNIPTPDSDLEGRLRRFRPVAPPPSLRARVLATQSERRAWPWVLGAAAALALVIALRALTSAALASAPIAARPDPWPLVTSALARQLGDGPTARDLASSLAASARERHIAAAEPSSREDQPWR